MSHRCCWCNGSDFLQELRPYGPGGALVCHGCVTDPAHPERRAAAEAMYEAEQRKLEATLGRPGLRIIEPRDG